MRKLLFGMLISVAAYSWYFGNILEPTLERVQDELHAAVIEPLLKLEQFSNDPDSVTFE